MSFLADSIYSKIISRNHDISRLSNVGHVKKNNDGNSWKNPTTKHIYA